MGSRKVSMLEILPTAMFSFLTLPVLTTVMCDFMSHVPLLFTYVWLLCIFGPNLEVDPRLEPPDRDHASIFCLLWAPLCTPRPGSPCGLPSHIRHGNKCVLSSHLLSKTPSKPRIPYWLFFGSRNTPLWSTFFFPVKNLASKAFPSGHSKSVCVSACT